MLVEVTERALAHTRKSGVLRAGGVGANNRLREMLTIMCEDRGATFHVPEKRFMGENGAMIGYTGLFQMQSGATISVSESQVIVDYRPDMVEVGWRK